MAQQLVVVEMDAQGRPREAAATGGPIAIDGDTVMSARLSIGKEAWTLRACARGASFGEPTVQLGAFQRASSAGPQRADQVFNVTLPRPLDLPIYEAPVVFAALRQHTRPSRLSMGDAIAEKNSSTWVWEALRAARLDALFRAWKPLAESDTPPPATPATARSAAPVDGETSETEDESDGGIDEDLPEHDEDAEDGLGEDELVGDALVVASDDELADDGKASEGEESGDERRAAAPTSKKRKAATPSGSSRNAASKIGSAPPQRRKPSIKRSYPRPKKCKRAQTTASRGDFA